jgi:hypothetical protein
MAERPLGQKDSLSSGKALTQLNCFILFIKRVNMAAQIG